jgi:hypothetical protein
MENDVALIAGACAILAFLVWLMWRSATEKDWGTLTATEKKKWRLDEEKRKESE